MKRCLALFALLMAAPLSAGEIHASATADRTTATLSQSVLVTLAVEGDAPLRVEPAAGVLDEASGEVWRARAVGLAKAFAPVNGRQRWEQDYRLDPFVPGSVPLAFAPLKVYSGTAIDPVPVDGPRLTIEVTTNYAGNPAEARTIEGVEAVPDEPTTAVPRVLYLIPVGVVVLAGALLAVRRWHRPPELPSPRERAIADLARLEDPAIPDREFAERLVAAVLVLAEARPGTTAEVLALAPDHHRESLEFVLTRCDVVKFANVPIPAEARSVLVESARQLERSSTIVPNETHR